ncbi:hypothetical protein BASA50_003311 [Batrachochytrium salamandrivorans]|uniref:Uncharacterized protein n=1 Tax=Batrachochytrium salamandrivorans TaxID=1357716 RepID=A0ABQ8FIT6_9FUNG|nr:hypothetical protein BASA50_003311 [Batrachochytrium salamandrivorans]
MKLVSFAALSLLAITASAQSLQSSTSKNTQSPQSATSKNSRSSCQDSIQAKLKELMTVHQVKKDAVVKMSDFDKEIQDELDSRPEADKIKERMKETTISKSDKLELKKQYDASVKNQKSLLGNLREKQDKLDKAKEERDAVEIQLKTLEGNQKRLNRYNTNNKVQIGLLPGSLYNKKILGEQSEEICYKSEDLSRVDQMVWYSVTEINRAMNRLGSFELDELKKISKTTLNYYNKLTKRAGFTKKHCSYTKRLGRSLSLQSITWRIRKTCQLFV